MLALPSCCSFVFVCGHRQCPSGFVFIISCISHFDWSLRLPESLRLPLDLSYGIYIYAFPIQQLSAMITSNFWIALLFSTTATLILALLSTLFIELPAQRLKIDLSRWTSKELDQAVVGAQASSPSS